MVEEGDRLRQDFRAGMNIADSTIDYPAQPKTELADIVAQIHRLDREHVAELADVMDRHRRERGALIRASC